jgi:hypothetical protein
VADAADVTQKDKFLKISGKYATTSFYYQASEPDDQWVTDGSKTGFGKIDKYDHVRTWVSTDNILDGELSLRTVFQQTRLIPTPDVAFLL